MPKNHIKENHQRYTAQLKNYESLIGGEYRLKQNLIYVQSCAMCTTKCMSELWFWWWCLVSFEYNHLYLYFLWWLMSMPPPAAAPQH